MHLGWSIRSISTTAAPPFARQHVATCACGWGGPVRRDLEMAREDGRQHSETDWPTAPGW